MRAPRRPRTTWFTPSRCRSAPRGRAAWPSPPRASTPPRRTPCAEGRDRARRDAPARRGRLRRAAAHAASATICCASMSSGWRGGAIVSSCPARNPRTSAAHSTSSSRLIGKKRAFGVAPRQWPERPTRCSATCSAPGLPSCATRSDRADVDAQLERGGGHDRAKRPRLEPVLRRRGAGSSRGSRGAPPPPRRRAAPRARARPARPAAGCSRRPAWCGSPGPARRSGRRSRPTAPSTPPRRARPSGSRSPRSSTRPRPTSTMAQSAAPRRTRPAPTRKRATSSTGVTVAESPMRCGRRVQSASSRSSERARWLPRLSRATAWISSTMTLRTDVSDRRPFSLVSRR